MSEPQTPPEVAAAASVPAALDLSDLTLIGVFRGPESARVLLRLPSGEIAEHALGDQLSEGQIVSIGEDWITLARNGRETVLRMPGA